MRWFFSTSNACCHSTCLHRIAQLLPMTYLHQDLQKQMDGQIIVQVKICMLYAVRLLSHSNVKNLLMQKFINSDLTWLTGQLGRAETSTVNCLVHVSVARQPMHAALRTHASKHWSAALDYVSDKLSWIIRN